MREGDRIGENKGGTILGRRAAAVLQTRETRETAAHVLRATAVGLRIDEAVWQGFLPALKDRVSTPDHR